MQLDLPVVGTTAGPEWATKLNTAFTAVDAHDHSTNKGTQIPTGGIADLAVTSAKMSATGVSATSYQNPTITVDAAGRITAASNGFSLIEARVVGSNSASQTFSSLDGENDGGYRIEFYIIDNSAAGALYSLRPNGLTTNQFITQHYFGHGHGASTGTSFALGGSSGIGYRLHGWLEMRSKTGRPRYLQSRLHSQNPGVAANTYTDEYSGVWNESATALASLEILASAADGIGTGSILCIYRMKRSSF